MKRKRITLIILLFIIFLILGFSFLTKNKSTDASQLIDKDMELLKNLYLSYQSEDSGNYEQYLNRYAGMEYQGEELIFGIENYDKEPVIGENELTAVITVEKEGLYQLSYDYRTLSNNILSSGMSLYINGELPYEELRRVLVSDTWKSGEIVFDRYGNESIAMPEKQQVWKRGYLNDTAFLYSMPMLVYLNKGENEITFTSNEGTIELGNLYLSSGVKFPNDSKQSADGSNIIILEAESFNIRNSPNIRTEAVFNTSVTPYDPKFKKQNTVSEDSFKTGGTYIEYEFSIVEDGWYHLAFDYIQSVKSDFTVYRNIYIDDEVFSKAFLNVAFPYSKSYTRLTAPGTVFLDKGKHILKLEVSLDAMRYPVAILKNIVTEINELALSISKITGGNTDKYRDFQLELYGFDIEGQLLNWASCLDELTSIVKDMYPEYKKVGELAFLEVAAKTLKELAKKPNELPQNLNLFSYSENSVRQNITKVIDAISTGNLGLDKIYIYQKDAEFPEKMSFAKKLSNYAAHFIAGFTSQDYEPEQADEDVLTIWVNRPRQYIEIMQRMADTSFTEKTGIKVNLSIVPDQQKLILANASNKTPDAAIGIASGYVYDLALRGALVDMRQFDNFKEVGKRFAPGMLIPGICDEGVYAVPETFNFFVLFYRKDIMESLNLEIPDTMDEVRKMLPTLTRLGLKYNNFVSNFITKPISTTAPFIFQAGGSFFEEGSYVSNLETVENIRGLKYLTENYTIHNMDYEVLSFYQAFRDGRMPIGTSDYGTYNLLMNAAPELSDLWDIALYPGIVDESGVVNRSTSGAAESCVIFKSDNQSENAWKFIDWWTSNEIQTEFAYTLQSTLGNEYLWNSANLEAIYNSPWKTSHKAVIIEQLKWTNEVPKIPGSYIIEREMATTLISVCIDSVNIRSAVDQAQKRINSEIERKMEEFGYIDKDGRQLKELIIPSISLVEEWLNEE